MPLLRMHRCWRPMPQMRAEKFLQSPLPSDAPKLMLQNSCFGILVPGLLGAITSVPLSGPRPLLSSCGQIASASLAVNQTDDDVPHDRTPIVDQGVLITGLCFRLFSRAGKMASSARGIVSWARVDETASRARTDEASARAG